MIAPRRKRITIAAGVGALALATIWWIFSSSPHDTGPARFFGLGLTLTPRPARIEARVGVPFDVQLDARISRDTGQAGGEWLKVISETLDSSRLRHVYTGAPHQADWHRSLVCVTPHAGKIEVTARVDWRPPGGSGFDDRKTGVEATVTIPVECKGPPTATCGDGRVTHDEECEAGELLEDQLRVRQNNGHRVPSLCTLLRKGMGTLRCREDCRYETRGCVVPATCGNGQLDPNETCDGQAFGSATCGSEGFSAGSLRCREDCQLDTSRCVLLYL